MAGNITTMTVTGTSTAVGGSTTIWNADLMRTPFSVTISAEMNSTATTPNFAVLVSNDTTPSLITASSSSASNLSLTSTVTYPNSSVVWFSSFGATNSSNALINITAPFRWLTLTATAGTSNGNITATIVQAG